jgi:hypothetical protein
VARALANVERGEDADRAVVRRVDDDAAVEGALEQVVAAVRAEVYE